MEKLRPFPKCVHSTNGSRKAVYCFPFVVLVKNLLDDQFLMQQEYCLFSFDAPFAIQEDTGVRTNVNCYWFWHEIQKEMCTGPTDFFAPLVLFIDSNMYGKVSVEPLMMTGGGSSKAFAQRRMLGNHKVSSLTSKWRAESWARRHQSVCLRNITLHWMWFLRRWSKCTRVEAFPTHSILEENSTMSQWSVQ